MWFADPLVVERHTVARRERARSERTGIVERDQRAGKISEAAAERRAAAQCPVVLFEQQYAVDRRSDDPHTARDLIAHRIDR